MAPSPIPTVSADDSDTAVRVLEHIMLHGLGGLPMEKANRIRILAKDIGAGRYYKPGEPMRMFSRCYICRRQREYDVVPDAPPCAQNAALVTGGRINLGFSVALALLRGGASPVIVTTRFPEDALRLYALEPDYNIWETDLKSFKPTSLPRAPSNGTIPPTEQQRLIAGEESLVTADHHALAVIDQALITTGVANSWEARYNEFSYRELLDVLAINAVCPFILIRECISLMLHDEPTHIVNVSSREGMFEAALNMCTQTLAEEFKFNKVYMNSVDPGYLSHQHSITHNGAEAVKEPDVPLTWADGAARVLNPIIRTPLVTGSFFKDYRERDWMNGWV
ncbi:hypothetical protein K438DRAFT_1957973 [Mycena galopus ATCC 62051]|nr:hypothetical protein K438DRAFT_1957973 [Mycena galopus ATCC 62051]